MYGFETAIRSAALDIVPSSVGMKEGRLASPPGPWLGLVYSLRGRGGSGEEREAFHLRIEAVVPAGGAVPEHDIFGEKAFLRQGLERSGIGARLDAIGFERDSSFLAKLRLPCHIQLLQ